MKVVDGDTVDAEVDLGFDIRFTMKIRLFGINAPEKNTPEGKLAAQHLTEILSVDPNARVILQTQKDRTEKYGRYLGTFRHLSYPQETSINDLMVSNGDAVPYFGGKR